MEYIWHLTFLSCFTTVLADYYIDNANTSIRYSTIPGADWANYSTTTTELQLVVTNSTGNYTIPFDASHCYDQNYIQGACTAAENCFLEIPFIGSGITIYVFNAGLSGMSANFAIDGGAGVNTSLDAPPPPTYQVPNVSLHDTQGLPSGNHTMRVTMLDWGSRNTILKFDYAHVNETFVAPPATTSSMASASTSVLHTSSQTTSTGTPAPSRPNRNNTGGIVGATLGGLALLAGILIGGYFCWRRRKAARRGILPSAPSMEVSPFTSEVGGPTPPPVFFAHKNPFDSRYRDEIPPHTRSTILRDAHAVGSHSSSVPDPTSLSTKFVQSSGALQPLRRPPSPVDGVVDMHPAPSPASYIADSTSRSSPFSDPDLASRYNLTAEQGELVRLLQRDNVPMETVARVIEGYVSSNFASGGEVAPSRARSVTSMAPPPSYQTRDD